MVTLLSLLIPSALGIVSLLGIMIIMVIFGKHIKLQAKIFLFKKKGYILLEKIIPNRPRKHYFTKAQDNVLDVEDGYYVIETDCIQKIDGLMPEADGKINDDDQWAKLRFTADKSIKNSDSVRWGIPIISYIGSSPLPVDFRNANKPWNTMLIRPIYQRALTMTRFNQFRKMIIIAVTTFIISSIVLGFLYYGLHDTGSTLRTCTMMWNQTTIDLTNCLNVSARIAGV